MSLFRTSKSKQVERTSVLIQLKIISKKNEGIDETEAWQALIDSFKKHPNLDVFQAEFHVDKEGTVIRDE